MRTTLKLVFIPWMTVWTAVGLVPACQTQLQPTVITTSKDASGNGVTVILPPPAQSPLDSIVTGATSVFKFLFPAL